MKITRKDLKRIFSFRSFLTWEFKEIYSIYFYTFGRGDEYDSNFRKI
jgi:hypothetical protein